MTVQPDARSESKTDTSSIQDDTLIIQRRKRVVLTNERGAELLNIINSMKLRGNTTLVGIANEMNKREIPALRGGQWTAVQISQIL